MNLWLRIALIFGSSMAYLLLAVLGLGGFAAFFARWIGVVLVAAGCWLRIQPVYELGNRFSGLVAIQKDHTLVTTGLYAHIRNPSYLGLLVTLKRIRSLPLIPGIY